MSLVRQSNHVMYRGAGCPFLGTGNVLQTTLIVTQPAMVNFELHQNTKKSKKAVNTV